MTGIAARAELDALPAPLLILGGICSVQFGAAFANKLFDQAGPAGVVLLRLGLSAIILLAITRPKLAGRSKRELLAAVGFGVVLGAMNWSFYEALHRLPLGPAVTIEFAGPLSVAILGSRRWLDLVWATLAGGGVALLAFGSSGGPAGTGLDPAGVLLALLAGVLWAAYILLSQRVGSAFSGLQGLALALSVGAILLIVPGIAQGGGALLRPGVLFGGLCVALLSSLIPYSLELTALRRLRAATFGLLMSLEPAVAALAGIIVLSQHPRATTVIAVGMVIIASVGTTLRASRSPTAAPLG
jgi:inner membrane transporter RhtA